MVQIQKITTLLTGIRPKLSRNKDSTKTRGDFAEDLALAFFYTKEFKLLERNFNCKLGEVDLIMNDHDYLVFIEVRHRLSNAFGGAIESITLSKQAKIRRAAQLYLLKTKNNDCPCRFDILCINGSLVKPEYQWVKNAF